MRKVFIMALAVILWSCGGGSDDVSSAIEGTWRGDLFQGMVSCSNGTYIGAGGGSIVGSVDLKVSGTDEIGSVVNAIDGNCLFQGTREADGFRAEAVSGCEQGLDHIQFNIISENEAGLSYHYDLNKVPAGDNGIRCKTTPSGIVYR